MRTLLFILSLLLVFSLEEAQPATAAAFYDDPPAPTTTKPSAASPAKQEDANKAKEQPAVKQEPAAAPEMPKPAPTTSPLSGKVSRVINTATLELQLDSRKQKKIVLFGIEKATGPMVGDLLIMIGTKGSRVSCLPAEQETYRCQTLDGMDVGKEALQKGIARALPSAPPEYLQAEGEAMKAKTGIWR